MEDFSQYNGEGTTLRKVQLRLVDMLVEIDKICRKHNIQYWLDCGTLLGAVRHGGFIPWDDDLDISMPTSDYKRFLEIAPKELPDSLFFQSKQTEPYWPRDYVRVRDNNSLFITKNDDFSKNYHKGLFVDVFEIVPYPSVNHKLQKFFFRWYRKTEWFFYCKQDITPKNVIAAITFPIIRAGLDCFWSLLSIGKKNKYGYYKSYNVLGVSFSEDLLYPLKDIQFEGHMFLGPADPDRYLRILFDEYMILPPKDKRSSHMVHVELR